jgi:flagellar basal-body rod modification protein FlgD
MSTSINPLAANPFAAATPTASNNNSSSSAAADANGAVTQQMFLQLLVAQLKNQDPTSPQDPTAFVGQLATFSQLEQTIAIRQDADTLVKTVTQPASNGN